MINIDIDSEDNNNDNNNNDDLIKVNTKRTFNMQKDFRDIYLQQLNKQMKFFSNDKPINNNNNHNLNNIPDPNPTTNTNNNITITTTTNNNNTSPLTKNQKEIKRLTKEIEEQTTTLNTDTNYKRIINKTSHAKGKNPGILNQHKSSNSYLLNKSFKIFESTNDNHNTQNKPYVKIFISVLNKLKEIKITEKTNNSYSSSEFSKENLTFGIVTPFRIGQNENFKLLHSISTIYGEAVIEEYSIDFLYEKQISIEEFEIWVFIYKTLVNNFEGGIKMKYIEISRFFNDENIEDRKYFVIPLEYVVLNNNGENNNSKNNGIYIPHRQIFKNIIELNYHQRYINKSIREYIDIHYNTRNINNTNNTNPNNNSNNNPNNKSIYKVLEEKLFYTEDKKKTIFDLKEIISAKETSFDFINKMSKILKNKLQLCEEKKRSIELIKLHLLERNFSKCRINRIENNNIIPGNSLEEYDKKQLQVNNTNNTANINKNIKEIKENPINPDITDISNTPDTSKTHINKNNTEFSTEDKELEIHLLKHGMSSHKLPNDEVIKRLNNFSIIKNPALINDILTIINTESDSIKGYREKIFSKDYNNHSDYLCIGLVAKSIDKLNYIYNRSLNISNPYKTCKQKLKDYSIHSIIPDDKLREFYLLKKDYNVMCKLPCMLVNFERLMKVEEYIDYYYRNAICNMKGIENNDENSGENSEENNENKNSNKSPHTYLGESYLNPNLDINFILTKYQKSLFIHSLTTSSMKEDYNYEILETLGDAVIKGITTISIYYNNPTIKEGEMVTIRSNLISNTAFYNIGYNSNIIEYILSTDLKSVQNNWSFPMKISAKEYYLVNTTRKCISDIVESTIGAWFKISMSYAFKICLKYGMLDFLLEEYNENNENNGNNYNNNRNTKKKPNNLYSIPNKLPVYEKISNIQKSMNKNNVNLFMINNYEEKAEGIEKNWSFKQLYETIVYQEYTANKSEIILSKFMNSNTILTKDKRYRFIGTYNNNHKDIEQLINYKFKDIGLLHKAYTPRHEDRDNNLEQLEFLGDALVEVYLITNLHHMLTKSSTDVYYKKDKNDQKDLCPGNLTHIKALLASNQFMIKINTMLNLHQYLNLGQSHYNFIKNNTLKKSITEYLKNINYNEPMDSYQKSKIANPKIISDTFEALIGAVFVDAWNICQVYKVLDVFYMPYLLYCAKYINDIKYSPVSEFAEICVKYNKTPVFYVRKDKLDKDNYIVEVRLKSSVIGSECDSSGNMYGKQKEDLFAIGEGKSEQRAKDIAAINALKKFVEEDNTELNNNYSNHTNNHSNNNYGNR